MKLEWHILTDEEAAESERYWRWGRDFEGEAYRALFAHLCEQDGGHDWYLTIDPDDGVWVSCVKCHAAGLDDVYPDSADLLVGEFEVYPGYVLGLHTGSVQLNGKETYGLFTYGWRGPVTARLEVICYPSTPDRGEEYDVWIEVDPR